MRYAYFHLFFLSIYHTSAKSIFSGVEQDTEWPHLLNADDSRPGTDGISHAINSALVAEHFAATTQHGTTLEDLLKPGEQHISLSYWDHWSVSRTDRFLRSLKDADDIAPDSTWRIDARGSWRYMGNMTLWPVL